MEELTSLTDWANRRAVGFHPVIAATLLFHEFESIHPFLDGNGRVGRVLYHTYLRTRGLPNSHLCMVERELVGNPTLYYQVLAWADHSGGYAELVDYFSEALLRSYEGAVKRFLKKDVTDTLDETAKRILGEAKRHGEWFRIEEACAWVDGRSKDTVRRTLNWLVDEEILETQGATKSKRYRYPDIVRKLGEKWRVEHTVAATDAT